MQDYVPSVKPPGLETAQAQPPSEQARQVAAQPTAARRVQPTQRSEEKSQTKNRKDVSLDELAEMLRKVNLTFDLFEIAAEYSVEEENHMVRVTLRNMRTGEVIRRIPPDQFVADFNQMRMGLGMHINASV